MALSFFCGESVIHYHGTPIGVQDVKSLTRFIKNRHFFVSFARPDQISHIAKYSSSFAIDNGAFSMWKKGVSIDWERYYAFIKKWYRHPRFDWCIIPDVIEGSEKDNDDLIDSFPYEHIGCPVWHVHESLSRLESLVYHFPRVCIGSSGEFSTIGTLEWDQRMLEAMTLICDKDGLPRAKLHGLRMLNPEVFCKFPFASADSTHLAQNITRDQKWTGTYPPYSDEVRAFVLLDRIESFNSADRWIPYQTNMSLFDYICR